MHRGYVKIWRCINDTGMMKNHGLFTFWVQCLLSASHKHHTQYVGNQAVDLEPGEFIFGRHSWAARLGATEKELRVWLENLQKTRRIRATKRASKYTVYSIINWEIYQQDFSAEGHEQGHNMGHEQGQQRASKGPAKGHKQELKHLNTEEKENIPHGDAGAVGEFYLTKKKRKLTGKRLETFNRFWEAYSYPKGKAEAADSWLDIPALTDSLVETIIAAARAEAKRRPDILAKNGTPKWAQGWLTARRWEDVDFIPTVATKSFTEQMRAMCAIN